MEQGPVLWKWSCTFHLLKKCSERTSCLLQSKGLIQSIGTPCVILLARLFLGFRNQLQCKGRKRQMLAVLWNREDASDLIRSPASRTSETDQKLNEKDYFSFLFSVESENVVKSLVPVIGMEGRKD